MRRVHWIATAGLVAGMIAVPPVPARADTFTYSGTVVDYNGGAPLGGIVVEATAPGSVTPDATVTTAADGTWSFDGDQEEYQLYFGGGDDYQSGYRTCAGLVTPDVGDACTVGPDSWPTRLFATWAAGYILDASTGLGVPGAVVQARQADGLTVIATDTTDAAGHYRVTGLAGDEISLYVDGSPVGYSSGWFGCAGVVATWLEACTFAPGAQDDRSIAPLSAPPVAKAFSRAPDTITLVVKAPSVGTPSGYLLTCTGPSGGELSAVYLRTLDSWTGFESGWNTCEVRAINAFGLGPASDPFRVRVR